VDNRASVSSALSLRARTFARGGGRHRSDVPDCTFEGGRSILGLVVFKRLKKLRIWYGDGGGEEWTGVDYSKPEIVTSVEGGRSIVLSADFRSVTFNDQEGEEHSGGHCRVASKRGKPAYWFAPKLTQH